MGITYQEILKANETINTTKINNKDYAEVNQRIKAFRTVYPEGFILTNVCSLTDGVCIIKAEVGYYEGERKVVLGTGTAYEKEGSTFINKTSYIENCETSAVGRALGMLGFGVDVSVASAEEVQTALLNQKPKEKPTSTATPKQIEMLEQFYKGKNLEKLLQANNITQIEDLPMKKASELIGKLMGDKKDGPDTDKK